MADRLAASTNTYHSYSLEEALDGIARAGFTSVELTSVPGWTEHVSRDADDAEIQRVKDLLAQYGLTAVSLSGHSDLVSDEGVAEFRKALEHRPQAGDHQDHDLDRRPRRHLQRQSRGSARGVPGAHRPAGRRSGAGRHRHLPGDPRRSAGHRRDLQGADRGHRQAEHRHQLRPRQRHPLRRRAAGRRISPARSTRSRTCTSRTRSAASASGTSRTVGTGEVDFPALFKVLDDAGFDGPCSIEIEFQGEPWPPLAEVDRAMAESFRYVRQFVPE